MINLPTQSMGIKKSGEEPPSTTFDLDKIHLPQKHPQAGLKELVLAALRYRPPGETLQAQSPSSPSGGINTSPFFPHDPQMQVGGGIDDIHHQLRLEQLRQEMDQSTRSSNNPPLIIEEQESLATFSHTASLQKLILESFWERLHAKATSLEATEQTLAEERERGRLANKLHAEFEAEVLQDGEHHPAEDLIQEALRTSQERVVLQWFETWAVDASQPSFAASVLRCLGRQERFGTDSWRTELIRKALSVDDVDIRDAAVQAVESWEDQELIQVLMGHDEPEHWLKDYIQGVICDLTH